MVDIERKFQSIWKGKSAKELAEMLEELKVVAKEEANKEANSKWERKIFVGDVITFTARGKKGEGDVEKTGKVTAVMQYSCTAVVDEPWVNRAGKAQASRRFNVDNKRIISKK